MRSNAGLGATVLVCSLACACHDRNHALSAPAGPNGTAAAVKLTLSSSAFGANGAIPQKFSCEGRNISPPLAWSGAPAATKSLALIVQDPDAPDPAAPTMVVTHWVVYDLPATATGIDEGGTVLPSSARQAKNEKGDMSYMGPCPPKGNHRYFFKLYALDSTLPALAAPHEKDVEQAMQGHVIGSGELIGTYQKAGS